MVLSEPQGQRMELLWSAYISERVRDYPNMTSSRYFGLGATHPPIGRSCNQAHNYIYRSILSFETIKVMISCPHGIII